MIEYSDRNRHSFRFGKMMALRARLSSKDALTFSMDRCEREPGTFKDECIATARLLSSKAIAQERRLFVLLSGLNSELIVKTMIEAGTRFEVMTYRLSNDSNAQEIAYVEKFCKRHNISPWYLDIDVQEWMNSGRAAQLRLNSFSDTLSLRICQMRVMSSIWIRYDGYPVLGGGAVDFRMNSDGIWEYIRSEQDLATFWHAKANRIQGATSFFSYTPEVVLAMFREPEIRTAMSSTLPVNVRETMFAVYKKYFPDLEFRPQFEVSDEARSVLESIRVPSSKMRTLNRSDEHKISYSALCESIKPLDQS